MRRVRVLYWYEVRGERQVRVVACFRNGTMDGSQYPERQRLSGIAVRTRDPSKREWRKTMFTSEMEGYQD